MECIVHVSLRVCEDCPFCKFFGLTKNRHFCKIASTFIPNTPAVPEWCPMVKMTETKEIDNA
jgi:hypothetical protein